MFRYEVLFNDGKYVTFETEGNIDLHDLNERECIKRQSEYSTTRSFVPKCDRDFIGVEMNDVYFNIAKNRIDEFQNNQITIDDVLSK